MLQSRPLHAFDSTFVIRKAPHGRARNTLQYVLRAYWRIVAVDSSLTLPEWRQSLLTAIVSFDTTEHDTISSSLRG